VPGPPGFTGRTELDIEKEAISTVIWTAGFRPDYGWVHIPVFDDMGFPIQQDGRSAVPGLYLMGVHFQRKARSAVLYGVAEDAEIVARHIAEIRGLLNQAIRRLERLEGEGRKVRPLIS